MGINEKAKGAKNSYLIQRLRSRMLECGLNARELAERADVGASFVYDILNGKSTNPTTLKLSKIAAVLDVDVTYLLQQDNVERAGASTIISHEKPGVMAIPALSVIASLNGGAVVMDENIIAAHYFQRHWIRDYLGIQANDLRIVNVVGDGMDPTLEDGDVVLVDTSQVMPSPAGLFVMFDGVALIVKRMEHIGMEEAEALIRISSDNHQYLPYTRRVSEMKIIGRVVWFSRTLHKK